MVAFESNSLSKLCSEDQLQLLNSIDRLRLQGINNYVSLPQIIVCGDQSSGKSSVLEALSGVAFPVESNLCTRFPTELVLRRSPHISASVSIAPHESRSESQRLGLASFQENLSGFDDLPAVIESAKLAMGISMHGKAFSKDLLRVEISGPNHPHLTIVDLPGLIHSETKHQTASDVELIQEVVQSYMEEPRSIILAVVSAKNDFANQVVLKLARKADNTGNRTLGVITKPDTLTPGSASESLFVSLARNHEVDFRLGWHVLKNKDSEKEAEKHVGRDASEADFFAKGIWTSLPLAHLGIGKLRDRLSKLLLRQISAELPGLIQEIDGKFRACHRQLGKLGNPRATEAEQRHYLFEVSQSFQALVNSSVDATCNHSFFEDPKSNKGYSQRIRAIVQNLNEEFASTLSRRGHLRAIRDKPTLRGEESTAVPRVTKDEFLNHIEELMKRTRGRELPGTFNPMIVADLFHEQSQPWKGIARRHVEKVWQAACKFLSLVVAYISDGHTANALQRDIVEPAMRDVLKGLRNKAAELVKPHQNSHPITYNHDFTETLQAVRRDRLRVKSDPAAVLREFFGVESLEEEHYTNGCYNLDKLARSLKEHLEPDRDRFAAHEALDCLNAYYKVALKRFIDDISVHAIEETLVSRLGYILSPVSIFIMDPRQVEDIAGESEESRAEREDLNRQLVILGRGLDTCKKFAGLRVSGDSVFATTNYDKLNRDDDTYSELTCSENMQDVSRAASPVSECCPSPEPESVIETVAGYPIELGTEFLPEAEPLAEEPVCNKGPWDRLQ